LQQWLSFSIGIHCLVRVQKSVSIPSVGVSALTLPKAFDDEGDKVEEIPELGLKMG
jgi:hypothetical protein